MAVPGVDEVPISTGRTREWLCLRVAYLGSHGGTAPRSGAWDLFATILLYLALTRLVSLG